MKEGYKDVLTELCNKPEFYHLDTLIDELQLINLLTREAVYEIKKHLSDSNYRTAVFDCLKQHEDSVLGDLEKIFEKNKWTSGVKLIQQRRNKADNGRDSKKQRPYFVFNVNKPVTLFTGREEKIEEIHDIISRNCDQPYGPQIFNSIIINGSSGIGKRQLILSYLRQYKRMFDSIVWINAESETAMKTSFYKLASKLKITSKFTFEALTKKVAQKIQIFGVKNLIIFENADDINPRNILPTDFENHYFLITSRHQFWLNSKIINLEALTEEEAIHFVEKSLETHIRENIESVQAFVLALQCFPLALTQAISYIKMKNKLELYTCNDYLTNLDANIDSAKILLSHLPKDTLNNGNLAAVNTCTTWRITFDKIKGLQYEKNGPRKKNIRNVLSGLFSKANRVSKSFDNIESLPARILNIAAYLFSNNIPIKLFFDIVNEDEHLLLWAIDILESYSFVTVCQGEMKIHKLIQQVTRLNLFDENRSEEFMNVAANVLLKTFPLDDDSIEAVSLKRTLLPHLIKLKEHVVNLKEQNKVTNEKFLDLICPLIDCIIDVCLYNMHEAKIAKSICEEMLSIQEIYYGPDHFQVATTLEYLGNAYGALGDHQKMKTLMERALQINELHYGPDHFQVASTLGNLAKVYGALGDPHKMKTLLETVLQIIELHFGPDHFQVATTLECLAVAYCDLGDPKNMKISLERALQLKERRYGRDHFRVASTLECLANAYGDLGDAQNMKNLLERALQILEFHYGPDHFRVASTLECLANAYGDLGDPQKMKILLERALQINELHFGSDHFQVASTLKNLANAYGALGDPQKMKNLLERALQINENHYGSDHFRVATTLECLGNAYGDLGDYQKMKTLLTRALRITELHYDPNHFRVATTLECLAVSYGYLGDPQKKKIFLERALQIKELHYGPGHIYMYSILINLAAVHLSLGNLQMHRIFLVRALQIKEFHYDINRFNVTITLEYLIRAFGNLNDPQIEKILLKRSLQVKERNYGNNHVEVARTFDLTSAYVHLGDPETMKTLLLKDLKIQKCHFGSNHYLIAVTLLYLGIVHGELGDQEAKKSFLETALKVEEQHYGPDHFEVALTLDNLANTFGKLNDPQTQKTLLERALKIKESHYGLTNYEVAKTRWYLAKCNIKLNEFQDAKELLEYVLPLFEQHYGQNHQYANSVRRRLDIVKQHLQTIDLINNNRCRIRQTL